MASGTQGYEAAQGDIIESLVDRFKKRKKNDKKGDTSPPPNQPASISVSTPTQKMLVQGKTVQQLMPGSSALATTTGGDITQYSSENGEVLSVLVRETQTTNKLLQAQNQLLLRGSKGGAITKFDKQEAALEETEDLSDTQGYEKAKRPTWLQDLLKWLLGNVAPILTAVKALAPAIAAAAGAVVLAIKGQAIAKSIAGLAQSLRGGRIRPVTVRDVTGMPRGALTGTNVKGALPPGRVTPTTSALSTTRVKPNVSNVTDTKALNASTAQKFDPQVKVKPETRVLETVDVDRGNFKGSDRKFEALKNTAQRGSTPEAITARQKLQSAGANVKPTTPAIPKGVTNSADDIVGAAGDLAKTGKKSGLRFLIPGASAITAGLSIISGDYAGAIVDSADAAGDLAVATGATGAAATVGTALSAGAAVIGAGITSSYIGEWTRGVGDWVRGDGNNAALNVVSSITEGLSAALETIGAPFRAIFEFINSGFNMQKSNDIMAEVDSNIRESTRQGLNAIDFLNIIPDEKGSFGTLGLYGDSAKKADAKMRGEGEVKNASGGSYFLDNPSNFGPFQGGEAGGEVVTFTPFGGRKLVNEMGTHMTDALQAPFQFAIGGIAAAVDKVITMLGPIGQFMKQAIGPKLKDLVKASGLTNLNLSSMSSQGGLGSMGGLFGGLTRMFGGNANVGGMPPNVNTPLNNGGNPPGGALRMGAMFTGQRNNSDFSAVLPQGNPAFSSPFGPRWGRNHNGIDIGVDSGSPVTSLEDGKVSHVMPTGFGEYGGAVFVKGASGHEFVYGHIDPGVQTGDEIKKGAVLGKITYYPGKDGSDQSHLHLERRVNNIPQGDVEAITRGIGKELNANPPQVPPVQQMNNPPVTPPPTIGSNFTNISAPGLSTTDQILMKSMPELFAAMQQMKAANNAQNNSSGGGNVGVGGTMQPATDPFASIYAPLHLSRLGAN